MSGPGEKVLPGARSCFLSLSLISRVIRKQQLPLTQWLSLTLRPSLLPLRTASPRNTRPPHPPRTGVHGPDHRPGAHVKPVPSRAVALGAERSGHERAHRLGHGHSKCALVGRGGRQDSWNDCRAHLPMRLGGPILQTGSLSSSLVSQPRQVHPHSPACILSRRSKLINTFSH